ncbi:MAG TPA: hypothetical protein VIL97_06935 [Thermoanaerobaculia bacterium]
MRRLSILLAFAVVVACASNRNVGPDERIEVDATFAGGGRPSSIFSFQVSVRNDSERILTIKRVQVEPIGGANVKPAFVAANKRIEPGETARFDVWAETDPRADEREIHGAILGVGQSIARVYVTFVDGTENVIAAYMVEL